MRRDSLRTIGFVLVFIVIAVLVICFDDIKAMVNEAMMGLQDFLKTIKKIKSRINPRLEVEGILLTMCEARTNLCKVISEQVAETFEGQIEIFNSKIPSTVKVGESIYYSKPLLEYAPETKACKATILMVTHDSFSASYAGRVIFIKDGRGFHEIARGDQGRKDFFDKIIDVVTLLGGDVNDAL